MRWLTVASTALIAMQSLSAIAAPQATLPTAPAQTTPVLAIQQWTIANGAQIYFVPEHQLPIVDIEILFNAGSAQDGSDYGVANFTNSMIGQGALNMNADAIADSFDSAGAQFDTNCARDVAQVTLRSLTDPTLLEPALKTFTQVLTQPDFSNKSFNRVRNQINQALLAQQQTPAALADTAFYNAIYGDYPYAHQPLGNADTLKRMTPNTLLSFYRQNYVGANATVAIVGDLTREQAEAIAKQVIGSLPTGKPAPTLNAPVYQPQTKNVNIAYPSTQDFIRIGQLGITRNDPNYFPLYVGNYVLGGGVLVSRLFTEVRDKRGLTYNVMSGFIPMLERGPFITTLQSSNNKSQEAIQITQDVIKNFIANGPTADELTAAKQNIIGGFPLLLNSNGNIADLVAMIGFYKLPLNYLDTYRGNITAVTQQQIQQAFSKQLNIQQMVTITVGPTPNEQKS